MASPLLPVLLFAYALSRRRWRAARMRAAARCWLPHARLRCTRRSMIGTLHSLHSSFPLFPAPPAHSLFSPHFFLSLLSFLHTLHLSCLLPHTSFASPHLCTSCLLSSLLLLSASPLCTLFSYLFSLFISLLHGDISMKTSAGERRINRRKQSRRRSEKAAAAKIGVSRKA